jgi:dihydrolipoamide dehydrogenase
MPSKALLHVANAFHHRLKFSEIGISGSGRLAVDGSRALLHVRNLRDRFVDSVMDGIEEWKDHLITAAARFADAHSLEVDGDRIDADRIIVATGSRPALPDAWRPCEEHVLTTDSLFDEVALPQRIAVIGLGPAGLEMSQALARLGVKVVGIDPKMSMGGLTSPHLRRIANDLIAAEFELVESEARPINASAEGIAISADDRRWNVDKVLLSVGRVPNTDGLGLENAGVNLGGDGSPTVNPRTMRIEGTNIYAAGDVLGQRAILHEAVDEGRIAGYNAAREQDQSFERRPPLAITFCAPNIAIVGGSRASLDTEGPVFAAGLASFAGQGRAIIDGENRGAAEIYLERNSGRLLGAELVAPQGEHLAHFLGGMLACKARLEDILQVPIYHPVLEEGLRSALKDAASRLQDDRLVIDFMRCEDAPAGAAIGAD